MMVVFCAWDLFAVVPEFSEENARICSQKYGFFIGVGLFSSMMNISAFLSPQTCVSAKKKTSALLFSQLGYISFCIGP